MTSHEQYLELCAAATAGELDRQEKRMLEEHLRFCATCQRALRDYEKVLQHGLTQLAAESDFEREEVGVSWSAHEAERLFSERLENDLEGPGSSKHDSGHEVQASFGKRPAYLPSQIRWREIWMPFAASIILGLALGIAAYRTGFQRGTETVRATPPPTPASSILLEEETRDAARQRAQLVLRLAEEDKLIADLRGQLSEQLKQIEAQKLVTATLGPGSRKAGRLNPAAGEGAAKAEEVTATAEAKVRELERAIEESAVAREEMRRQAATLEAKVSELTQLVRDREHSLDENQAELAKQQELLDHDRDIRELMGARDLYIAEVHDVAWTGKTDKTYGRVFYTKGKSLIFYAYDLDAQPGIRNAASFQAWGRRGPDKKQARNLGIFYEDNATKKRWVLKAEDPKSLEDIDAVFVTVEPNGGSHHPSGKQLLFAYLQVNPNHP
jgi:hypothetical protein